MSSTCTRILLTAPPFTPPALLTRLPWDPPEAWPCRWLLPPQAQPVPAVFAFRLVLALVAPLRTKLHVSADERYDLWLDGRRVGAGSERGDEWHWSYESYDLTLAAGRHVLCARVWALGRLAPWAQRSLGAGFLCAADGAAIDQLGSGTAPWRVRRLPGWRFHDPATAAGTGIGSGAVEELEPAAVAWDPTEADDAGWEIPVRGVAGNNGETVLLGPQRLLMPAALPPQRDEPLAGIAVRAVDDGAPATVWAAADGPLAAWSALLAGTPCTIPPHARVRVLLDTVDYACGRPVLRWRGGNGARISVAVTECLVRPQADGSERRGHRDPVAGGRVRSAADVVHPDGGERAWQPLWWRAGRWIELAMSTGAEPLTLTGLGWHSAGYPFAISGGALAADPATARIHAACRATWLACAHETFMDCPHYEQLMYVGDTRVQALLTYALSADARLPRRCLELFASGRVVGRGLIPDAYPAAVPKLIPPFALWWVGMLHDHAWWRGAPPAGNLRALRDLMERFLGELGGDGLWPSPTGWNYLDWTEPFRCGTPPGGEEGGRNASFSWQLATALGQWAELEDWHGEPELAARARRRQAALVAAIDRSFWDEGGGCYREDFAGTCRSEHVQILALLSGCLSSQRAARVGTALTTRNDLVRASAYFSHYLFEAYRVLGRGDLLQARLGDWTASCALGLVTTPETFGGEGRSDCHAWSAHPLFHHLATVLGIRPAAPAFARVRIAPDLGGLAHAAGTLAHPLGTIEVALRATHDGRQAEISLPPGLSGVFAWHGREWPLHEGAQRISVAVAESARGVRE